MERLRSSRVRLLSLWASLGLLVLLVGAWGIPSNKLYHQSIILFLWLPALLALFFREFWSVLKGPQLWLYVVLSVWTLLVLLLEGGDDPISKAKLPVYVGLTLLGFSLAARNERWQMEQVLFLAALVGGLFSGLSWLKFYWLDGHAYNLRLIAIGLWNTPILAAHAVGALAVLGALTAPGYRSKPWLLLLMVLAAAGYVLFLGFSQTRGVWIALLACIVVLAIAVPSRGAFGLVLSILAGIALIAFIEPHILLQRGVSYRPPLWEGGFRLMLENWQTGVGFNHYSIAVPGLKRLFDHPHNLFLNVGIQSGITGLLLFCALWLSVGWKGWVFRASTLGRAVLGLWVFSSVALLTDGIGLWLKPNADWLITWLPLALSMLLTKDRQQGREAFDK